MSLRAAQKQLSARLAEEADASASASAPSKQPAKPAPSKKAKKKRKPPPRALSGVEKAQRTRQAADRTQLNLRLLK
jgi:hypothetical protein